jgi:hypothetical protein
MRATCPGAHYTLNDLITLIILDEEYKLWISPSRSFLHPPATFIFLAICSATLNLCLNLE